MKIASNTPSYRKLFAVITSAVLGASALTLPQMASGASPISVFKVATSAAVTTWDPIQSFSTEAFYMPNIYEPLLWKNPDGAATEYAPGIATSWTHSTDSKTWTFKIRSGATFHDGTAVTAAAVKASFDESKKNGGAGFIWGPVDTFVAPSADTLIMNLGYAAPMDLIASSTYGAWVISPKVLAAGIANSKYYDSGIDGGSGPYTIKSYSAGSEVVLSAYPGYWGSKPTYKIVDALITPDAVTAQQMMTSGQVDWSTTIPLTSVAELKHTGKYAINVYKSPFNYVGYFNTLRAPLNNPKVRAALSMAIPYSDIVKIGGQGYGTQAHGPVPAGIYPFDPTTPQYKKKLATAKSLLAKLGVKNLSLKITYASENPAEARFVPLIASALNSIGINADVQAILFNQQWSAAKKDPANAQDIFIVKYWPTYSDAGVDNLWSLFHSSSKPFFNLSYWKNATYDNLVDDAAVLSGSDKAGAAKMYSQAMNILYTEAPGIYLYDEAQVTVVPRRLSVPKYNINYPFTAFFAGIKLAG